jgi:hypothetical protein
MAREDAEALRRRLYAPDASAEDVDRYRAVAPRAEVVDQAEPIPADAPAPLAPEPLRRARPARRRRVPLVVTGLVLAAVVAVALVVPRVVDRPADRVAPAVVSSDAQDRVAFLQNLDIGNQAGIAAYLVTHEPPPGLTGSSRYFTIERAGVGDRQIELGRVPADAIKGRATVLLVLGADGEAGWRTLRREVDSTGEQRYVPQRTRGGQQAAGVLTGTTFRYADGDRPVLLRVDAPAGVRWGVAVVFSD